MKRGASGDKGREQGKPLSLMVEHLMFFAWLVLISSPSLNNEHDHLPPAAGMFDYFSRSLLIYIVEGHKKGRDELEGKRS